MSEHVTPNRSQGPDQVTPTPPTPPEPDEDAPSGPLPVRCEVRAELVDRGWLRRVIEIETPEGDYFVEYNGRGLGYESVLVNGQVVERKSGQLAWFVPRFDFALGRRYAYLTVRVWPWLTIRSLELYVDGRCVYVDGS